MHSYEEDLTLEFINEVLNPILKDYSFIDTELGGGKVVFGLISSFMEEMEMNDFYIAHKDTNEPIFLHMFDKLRSKLWQQTYF